MPAVLSEWWFWIIVVAVVVVGGYVKLRVLKSWMAARSKREQLPDD